MKKRLLAYSLAALLLVAAPTVQAADYIMCPGDELSITVVGHDDISSTGVTGGNKSPYVVRPDGKLDFPLIGSMDTTGLTVDQFTQALQVRLAEYIIAPNVSINITKLGTTRVFVFGEVKRAGVQELDRSHNVLDAIGKAEGFTKDAAKKKVVLIRKGVKEEKDLIYVNFNNLLTKGDMSQNYQLFEGDSLYLTSNGKIDIARDIFPFISSYYYIKRADE